MEMYCIHGEQKRHEGRELGKRRTRATNAKIDIDNKNNVTK